MSKEPTPTRIPHFVVPPVGQISWAALRSEQIVISNDTAKPVTKSNKAFLLSRGPLSAEARIRPGLWRSAASHSTSRTRGTLGFCKEMGRDKQSDRGSRRGGGPTADQPMARGAPIAGARSRRPASTAAGSKNPLSVERLLNDKAAMAKLVRGISTTSLAVIMRRYFCWAGMRLS